MKDAVIHVKIKSNTDIRKIPEYESNFPGDVEVMLNPLYISALLEILGHFSVNARLLLLSHIHLSSLRIIPCPFLPSELCNDVFEKSERCWLPKLWLSYSGEATDYRWSLKCLYAVFNDTENSQTIYGKIRTWEDSVNKVKPTSVIWFVCDCSLLLNSVWKDHFFQYLALYRPCISVFGVVLDLDGWRHQQHLKVPFVFLLAGLIISLDFSSMQVDLA